ncbi:ABC transporter ATP-binding protein [Streptomyces eurythermus]|uniref:ABC transporter ATP-binding protein n=1 Tax=Streptomyces eurythermus TaxID=42237 RepID=UPI0036B68632
MLEVIDLVKRYGEVTAVDGVSFHVAAGEIVGLLGVNGAGKSTTLETIVGLVTPDSGTVTVDGHDVRAHPEQARAHIGFAAQDTALYPRLTVRENLRFFGRLTGASRHDADARADELIGLLGLTEQTGRLAGVLSGGEARRAHVAVALMARPRLLLLDEATVGLDVRTRTHMLELVVRAARESGAAVLFSSHYLAEVETICDRVVIIHRGRVLADGTVAETIGRHAKSAVEFTFGDGTRQRHEVSDPAAELPALLARLDTGAGAPELKSVNVLPASLETAFWALTGEEPAGLVEEVA